MQNTKNWSEEFDNTFAYIANGWVRGVGNTFIVPQNNAKEEIKQFISTKLAEQKKEIVEIIKTPMSTEFEDPEEESADYSIEDFRARLLNLIKQD
jgi:hypothetical protein